MDSNNFMRIFDDRNEHKLSIVACGNGYDLCCPNGKVVYCGVDPELVEVLEDYLIVKEFNLIVKEFNLIDKEFNLKEFNLIDKEFNLIDKEFNLIDV